MLTVHSYITIILNVFVNLIAILTITMATTRTGTPISQRNPHDDVHTTSSILLLSVLISKELGTIEVTTGEKTEISQIWQSKCDKNIKLKISSSNTRFQTQSFKSTKVLPTQHFKSAKRVAKVQRSCKLKVSKVQRSWQLKNLNVSNFESFKSAKLLVCKSSLWL